MTVFCFPPPICMFHIEVDFFPCPLDADAADLATVFAGAGAAAFGAAFGAAGAAPEADGFLFAYPMSWPLRPAYCAEKRYSVRLRNVSPGRRTVDGKSGLFGESG